MECLLHPMGWGSHAGLKVRELAFLRPGHTSPLSEWLSADLCQPGGWYRTRRVERDRILAHSNATGIHLSFPPPTPILPTASPTTSLPVHTQSHQPCAPAASLCAPGARHLHHPISTSVSWTLGLQVEPLVMIIQ